MKHERTYKDVRREVENKEGADQYRRMIRSKKAEVARLAGMADGKLNELDQARKIGRNERCPCNSGKKWKHCHGNLRKVAKEFDLIENAQRANGK